MNPKARQALLEMGEYNGPEDAFKRESARQIQGALKCSVEESERILQESIDRGDIDFRLTQGGELPPKGYNYARWYWYVPEEHPTMTQNSGPPGWEWPARE
jgi:hypothetical protein